MGLKKKLFMEMDTLQAGVTSFTGYIVNLAH